MMVSKMKFNGFQNHLTAGLLILFLAACTSADPHKAVPSPSLAEPKLARVAPADKSSAPEKSPKNDPDEEDQEQVAPGDLVEVVYTAVLDDGQRVQGPGSPVPGPDGRTRAMVVAGESTSLPGLGQAVMGMAVEKKQVDLSPEQAFGTSTRENRQLLPRVRELPLEMGIRKQDYIKMFKSLPSPGTRIQVNPYFKSQVIKVTDTHLIVKNLAQDGFTEQAPFGKTQVSVKDGNVKILLTPVVGAPFEIQGRSGRILSFNDKEFIVDFNHPHAGKRLKIDVEVISITQASVFEKIKIPWIQDHDLGYEIALEKKKAKVLVLYADWCQWCEKMFAETFTDPRIKKFKDEFVWVKANSDQDRSLKDLYGQEGFPMVVLTDSKGSVYKKMEGFKDAESLMSELEQMITRNQSKADT